MSTLGPTLQDLTAKIGIDYEEISRAMVVIGPIGFIGCLIGGAIYERIPRSCDLMVGLAYLLFAGIFYALPQATSLDDVFILFASLGFVKGIGDIGRYNFILRWELLSPKAQLIHCNDTCLVGI